MGEHVAVAVTLSHLGSALGSLGDYQKQKELLERALSIQEREYGPEHVRVAVTSGSLGNAFGDLGDYQKAKELLERAYNTTKKEFGSGHTRFAHVCIGLAKTHGC